MVVPRARERRVGRRVGGGFRVALDSAQFGTLLQVRDVSMSGVSFHLTKAVDYMTRVQLVMWLPSDAHPGSSSEHDCAGVVVRCEELAEPASNSLPEFEVAVFFTDLPEGTIVALQDYVESHPTFDDATN